MTAQPTKKNDAAQGCACLTVLAVALIVGGVFLFNAVFGGSGKKATAAAKPSSSVTVCSGHAWPSKIPNVTGRTYEDVSMDPTALECFNLVHAFAPDGHDVGNDPANQAYEWIVTGVTPKPGTEVNKDTPVTLEVKLAHAGDSYGKPPFATTKPHPDNQMAEPTCVNASYTRTSDGVMVRMITQGAPGLVTLEAEDSTGTPVDQNSDVFLTIKAPGVHTALLKGVHSLSYVDVLPTGYPADSCAAYAS